MCMQAPWFADETLTRFARTLSAPIFLSLARHGEDFGVLDLHPIRRAPGAVKRAKPLRYNPFTAKLARLAEYDLAIFLDMLIVRSRNDMRSSIETAQKRVESVCPRALGAVGGWVPGALARSDMVRANAGRPTKATKSALASFRLTEQCGNRRSRDGLQPSSQRAIGSSRARRMIDGPGRREAAGGLIIQIP